MHKEDEETPQAEAKEHSAPFLRKALRRKLSVKDAGHRSTHSDYSKKQRRKSKRRR
jgi:hypothetical protein